MEETIIAATIALYIPILTAILKLYSKVARLEEEVRFLNRIILRFIKLNDEGGNGE